MYRSHPILLFLPALLILAAWGHNGPRVKVGFFGGDFPGQRAFLSRLRESVERENADLIESRPGEKAGSLLGQGVQVLVLYGGRVEKGLVAAAHAKGVPVLSVGEPLAEGGQDFLVTFDPHKEGELQAGGMVQKRVTGSYCLVGAKPNSWFSKAFRDGQIAALRPHVEKGDVTTVTVHGDPRRIDAYLVYDPSELSGVRAEMNQRGLQGQKHLAGVGVDLDSCRAIRAGTQTITVYRSPLKLAEESAYLAVKAARKAKTFDCQFVDIPHGSGTVRSVLLTPKVLDASSLETTVVKDGIWTREELEGKKP